MNKKWRKTPLTKCGAGLQCIAGNLPVNPNLDLYSCVTYVFCHFKMRLFLLRCLFAFDKYSVSVWHQKSESRNQKWQVSCNIKFNIGLKTAKLSASKSWLVSKVNQALSGPGWFCCEYEVSDLQFAHCQFLNSHQGDVVRWRSCKNI